MVGPSLPVLGALFAVTALSTNDIWAVGYSSLIMHWDGDQWATVDSPVGKGARFNSISAATPTDVWIVRAYTVIPGSYPHTLALHWDGVQWSDVPTDEVGALRGVEAVSANDVWAVGSSGQARRTLVTHWNGVEWSVVSSPNFGSYNALSGVTAVAANDVWVVGYSRQDYPYSDQTLTMHWDGAKWSRIPSANASEDANHLTAVTAISSNDVWAVGYYGPYGDVLTLTEHWDGISWSVVHSPNVDAEPNRLYGITALSANDVWAVGSHSTSLTLVEHWDGNGWSVSPSPNNATTYNWLNAITAVSPSEVWAAGASSFVHQTTGQSLIERWTPNVCATPL